MKVRGRRNANGLLRTTGAPTERRHGLRKHMARAMVSSATEAPQATLMKTVDAAKLLDLQSESQERREFQDFQLTPFALIAHCFVRALSSLPLANASFESENNRIVVHDSINLGIAIATGQGLVVPNIKSAGSLSFSQFMKSLRDVVDDARQGQLLPIQISGGTVTMTNIGALGMDMGALLINFGISPNVSRWINRPQTLGGLAPRGETGNSFGSSTCSYY